MKVQNIGEISLNFNLHSITFTRYTFLLPRWAAVFDIELKCKGCKQLASSPYKCGFGID